MVCEVSLHSTRVSHCHTDYCPGSYCSISLLPSTVRQGKRNIMVSFVLIRFVISELLDTGGQVGHGLVQASSGLFRHFFTITRTRETLWYLIYPSPRRSSLYRHGQRNNGQTSMVFGSVYSLMFIAWHFKTVSFTRKGERNILVP